MGTPDFEAESFGPDQQNVLDRSSTRGMYLMRIEDYALINGNRVYRDEPAPF